MDSILRSQVGIVLAISLMMIWPASELSAQELQQMVAQQGPGQSRGTKRAAPRAPHRAISYPAVGHQVRTLPRGHVTVLNSRKNYRYYNGVFYRPGPQGDYIVVRAPLGARVPHLPPGYISFFIGPSRYFYVNFTYYLWDRDTTEYIVVEEPEGATSAVVTASETTSGEIFVYPNEGQSDEQRERDRYECYLWAVEQTGFDPGTADPEIDNAGDYRRAISACLEGRGYTVK